MAAFISVAVRFPRVAGFAGHGRCGRARGNGGVGIRRWGARMEVGAFNSGTRYIRRAVGKYELTRLSLTPSKLIPEGNEGVIFSLMTGIFVFLTLVFPLVDPGPETELWIAGTAGMLLGIWMMDTLVFSNLLMKWLWFGMFDKKRVYVHEAGHFVVGYILGVKAKGYRIGIEGSGVEMDDEKLDIWKLAAVGMGGIVAEIKEFGKVKGGEKDYEMVGKGCKGREEVMRWGLKTAWGIVEREWNAVNQVAEGMKQGMQIEQLGEIVEREWQGLD